MIWAGIINNAIMGPFAVRDGCLIVCRIPQEELPFLVQEAAISPKEEGDIYARQYPILRSLLHMRRTEQVWV